VEFGYLRIRFVHMLKANIKLVLLAAIYICISNMLYNVIMIVKLICEAIFIDSYDLNNIYFFINNTAALSHAN
jgi:hypothetical protein